MKVSFNYINRGLADYLKICGTREGYTTGQCDRTMTVGELIRYLEDFESNMPVYLSHDNGYTYGSVTDNTVYPAYYDDSEDED